VRHRSRTFPRIRGALLLLALLSAVVLGGVQSASCEMHGLGAMRGRMTGMQSEMPDRTPAAMLAGFGHQHGRSDRGHRDGDCCCSCIGECTMVAQLVPLPTSVEVRVALVVPQPRRVLDAEPAQSPPLEPDRLLPFANGPPALAFA
jgi:hypothetical protein